MEILQFILIFGLFTAGFFVFLVCISVVLDGTEEDKEEKAKLWKRFVEAKYREREEAGRL